MPEQIEAVVIGGGQAGLAISYYLTHQGRTARGAGTGRPSRACLAAWALGLLHPRDPQLVGPVAGLPVSG